MINFHLERRIDDGSLIFMVFAIPSRIKYGDGYIIPERLSVFQIIIQIIVYSAILWKLFKTKNEDTYTEYVFDAYFWAIMLNKVVNPQFFLTIIAMSCFSRNERKLLFSLLLLTFYWSLLYIAYLIGYDNFGGPAYEPT